MAANVALSSSLGTQANVRPKSSPFFPLPHVFSFSKKRIYLLQIHAQLGEGDGELKPEGKKKFITKEEEPEQYWQTAGEREGENPMKTPLPYIVIFGMSTPFVILAIAFANGWIKVPVRLLLISVDSQDQEQHALTLGVLHWVTNLMIT